MSGQGPHQSTTCRFREGAAYAITDRLHRTERLTSAKTCNLVLVQQYRQASTKCRFDQRAGHQTGTAEDEAAAFAGSSTVGETMEFQHKLR